MNKCSLKNTSKSDCSSQTNSKNKCIAVIISVISLFVAGQIVVKIPLSLCLRLSLILLISIIIIVLYAKIYKNKRRWNRIKRCLKCIIISKWLFEKISKINCVGVIIFTAVMFCAGQIISDFSPYQNLKLFQILLIGIIIITFYAIKGYREVFSTLYSQIKLDSNLELIYDQFGKYQRSLLLFLIALILPWKFLCSFYSRDFIDFTYIGIYGFILVYINLFIAFLGYGLYVILLWFLYKLTKTPISNFDFYSPADTPWLVKISRLGRFMSNNFFILGMMYTAIYAFVIPEYGVKATFDGRILNFSRIVFNSHAIINFLKTWGTILSLIVLMFPILLLLQRYFIKKIIRNLKDSSMGDLQNQIRNDMPVTKENLSNHKSFATSIKEIKDSPNFPLPSRNYIPYVSTAFSFLFSVFRIFDLSSLVNLFRF